MVLELVRTALHALSRNRVRAVLTMLGVMIGVGAVIAMVSLGRGAQAQVREQMESMGSNLLYLRPGSSRDSGGMSLGAGSRQSLSADDVLAIEREVPAVRWASPTVGASSPIVFGNRNWSTRVEGTSETYDRIRNWKVVEGRFFDSGEVRTAARVAVLGRSVADQLFEGADPVGQTIRIRNLPFRVVGVLAEKGENQWGRDQDDTIMAPYTTVMRKLTDQTHVSGATIKAASAEATYTAEVEVRELLRQRHGLGPRDDDDFSLRNMADIQEAQQETSRVLTILLGSIASVSLIVGGIGIMNIMLVSVKERTREIGVRRAVGASRAAVRTQFLIEAVLLSFLGGTLGVALGIGASHLIAGIWSWPVLISLGWVLGAVLFSGLVGVFFGYYPAHQAARLDPIDALRYE